RRSRLVDHAAQGQSDRLRKCRRQPRRRECAVRAFQREAADQPLAARPHRFHRIACARHRVRPHADRVRLAATRLEQVAGRRNAYRRGSGCELGSAGRGDPDGDAPPWPARTLRTTESADARQGHHPRVVARIHRLAGLAGGCEAGPAGTYAGKLHRPCGATRARLARILIVPSSWHRREKKMRLLICVFVLLASFAALSSCSAVSAPTVPAVEADWPYYGGDPGGSRYSPAAQITPDNVDRLQVAWTFRTGEHGEGFPDDAWADHMTWEATPILYDGALYFTTSETNVVAIDAATGKLRWRHDSHVPRINYSDAASRGVSLWVDPQSQPDAPCHARIFAPVLDSKLLALDAKTGKPCVDFADHGALDLLNDIHSTWKPGDKWRDYLVTSPPVVIDGKVVIGSSIGDNRGVQLEHGTVRAYDARSGKFIWGWDPIPRNPSDPMYSHWNAHAAQVTGAANAWAPLSADPARHLVFVPTGSASPDFFGGLRTGDNRWADSLVALDTNTGKPAWAYQLVHHDLWDYDAASQPSLVQLQHDGRTIPAVIQPSKMGMLFTFDRTNGAPVFPIVEKPVP